tara:strand:+ start:168 stop:653 length:486 start_codon:yes stop_codon:yes gene_type:complete
MSDKDKLKKSLNLTDKDFDDAEDFENDILGKEKKPSNPSRVDDIPIVYVDAAGNPIEDDDDELDWDSIDDLADDEPLSDPWNRSGGPRGLEDRRQLSMFSDEEVYARGRDEHFGYGVVDSDDTCCMGIALNEDIHPGKYDIYVVRDAFGRPAEIKIIIPND